MKEPKIVIEVMDPESTELSKYGNAFNINFHKLEQIQLQIEKHFTLNNNFSYENLNSINLNTSSDNKSRNILLTINYEII